MTKEINKVFETVLSTVKTKTKYTNFSCFHGESVVFNLFITDYDMTNYDYSDTNVKVYYVTSDGAVRQDDDIDVTKARDGYLKINVKDNYIRLGINIVKVIIYTNDEELNFQPFAINCISSEVGKIENVEIDDSINVKDEFVKLRKEVELIESKLDDYISNGIVGSIDLSSYQKKTDSDLKTTSKTVAGAINENRDSVISANNRITNLDTSTQKKTDSDLKTTSKTVTGAINENRDSISYISSNYQNKTDSALKTTSKSIVGGINDNRDSISYISSNYQNKTDSALKTTSKSIVGGINDNRDSINSLNSNLNAVRTTLEEHIENHPSGDAETPSVDLSLYQKKTDSALETESKTIVGAINENRDGIVLVNTRITNLDTATQKKTDSDLKTTSKTITGAINENRDSISTIQSNYQNKSDSTLKTTSKSVVGAINENRDSVINANARITSLDSVAQRKTDSTLKTSSKDIVGAINNNRDSITYMSYTYQLKNDTTLNTTSKTVTGAINENRDNIINANSRITNLDTAAQKKTDSALKTTSKTVTGAINENRDSVINANARITNLDTAAQKKTDSALKTTSKTVTGAINENRDNIINANSRITSLDSVAQRKTDSTLKTSSKDIVGAINNNRDSITYMSYTYQLKNDTTLNTTSKTVAGAINENRDSVISANNRITNLDTSTQKKTDSDLKTTSKTVTGAINENRDNIINANSRITNLDTATQKKTDNALKTTSKSIVGGINDNRDSISYISSNYQQKTDNALKTTSKSIVGGINNNRDSITHIANMYQQKTDNALTTSSKNIVGAINENTYHIRHSINTEILKFINSKMNIITDKESKKYEKYLPLGDNFTNYVNTKFPGRYKNLKVYVDGDICFIQGIIDMKQKYAYNGSSVTTDSWHYQIVKDKYLDAELIPYNGTVTGVSCAYKSDWTKIAPALIVVRNDGHIMIDRETVEIDPECIKYIIINMSYELGKSYVSDKYKKYVDKKKDDIMHDIKRGSKFTLVADTHLSVVDVREKQQDSVDFCLPRIINNISEHTNSLFNVFLGDNISENRSRTKEMSLNTFKYLNKMSLENTLFVAGNHDFAYNLGSTSDKYIKVNEMWDQLMNGKTGIVKNPLEPERMYYYHDDDINKVRYVVLNSMDLPGDVSKNTPGFLPNQVKWFVNEALNFEDNIYDVVVFSHHSLLDPKMLYPKGGEPTVKNVNMIKKIVENFANGVSGTVSSTESGSYACSVSTKFTEKRKIIHMFGHYHIDYAAKVNNVLHVCCDSAYPYGKEASLPSDGNGKDYDRTGDNELCISVVTIDTKDKKMYIQRIGAGSDREFDY